MTLDYMEELLNKATPGEWVYNYFEGDSLVWVQTDTDPASIIAQQVTAPNAELICSAPEIIRQLIARVRELEGRNEPR